MLCELSRSPMVGWYSGTLPTRVQILVLAPFLGFPRIYRHCVLVVSGVPVDNEAPMGTPGIFKSVGCS
jgi:hypothetical protein